MPKILQKNSPALRKKADPVAVKDITTPKIKRVISDMKKALAPHAEGVAIAAPQIGASLRIFVVSGHVFNPEALATDDKSKQSHNDLVFINPEIVRSSKEKKSMAEGCLSVENTYGNVRRATKTTVRAYDEKGKKFTRGGSGLLSQIFQHEIDHLEGILFTDKARNIKEIPVEKDS